ncbi:transforming growth factor beta activator LRRC32-like isoform X2 [Phycodurus eques]|uniref:transforming growth factor beta activator LRRC32-like isoform X2 n=1 Tax=Phycodurus eques TaxID=693459 RepID=UPI002ACE95CC|nr:transforming growth factor beta activator LRRC32-like isoform X2 [Phycodurus eques]
MWSGHAAKTGRLLGVSNMAAFPLLFPLLAGCVAAAVHPSRHRPSCRIVGTSVVCSDLSLTSAPANLPSGVQVLDLSQNQLQNLSRDTLADHMGLRHLDLHSNKIHFIQPGLFETMNDLKVLDLSGNRLNVFALAKIKIGTLSAVESLDLSSNGLYTGMSDIFLNDSPSLVELSLSGNSITKIAQNTFNGALSLRKISLHDNIILEIEDGAFDSLDGLSELDLSKNSIACITDFNLSRLRALNLSRNSLELFQSTRSAEPYHLAFLDLSENKLPYFPLLPTNNAIRHLDLSRNRLQSVDVMDMADTKMSETVLKHLRHLDLSFNQLTGLPQSFFNTMMLLEVLNVSNNCIVSFSVTDKDLLPTVKIVNFSYNSLQRLSLREGTLQALEELFLQGNDLSTLAHQTFQRLPSLNLLQLQVNNLRVCPSETKPDQNPSGCVSFSSVPKLKFLYLSQNNLKILPYRAFANTPLSLLDLSLNPGLEMHQDSLVGLEHSLVQLFLRENNISMLNRDMSSLRSLKLVDLSTNHLTSLPAWNRESSIETLNLQNNSLVTLEHTTMAALERSLKTLYVGDNPLSCCGNLDLVRLLQHSDVVVPDIEAATCILREGLEPVNIEKVTWEMCQGRKKANYIVVIVVIVFLAVIALGLLVKYCKSRKRKRIQTFSV